MNGRYMSWIESSIPGHATLSLKMKVLSITGEVFIDEFEVLNTDYINMTSLTPYTTFVPCFKVSTAREDLNVYGKFNCNFSSFISAESGILFNTSKKSLLSAFCYYFLNIFFIFFHIFQSVF